MYVLQQRSTKALIALTCSLEGDRCARLGLGHEPIQLAVRAYKSVVRRGSPNTITVCWWCVYVRCGHRRCVEQTQWSSGYLWFDCRHIRSDYCLIRARPRAPHHLGGRLLNNLATIYISLASENECNNHQQAASGCGGNFVDDGDHHLCDDGARMHCFG